MDGLTITIVLSAMVFTATPVVLAVIGETLSEKSGVINLSLDGSILLSAMGAFAIAVQTDSLMAGFIAGAFIGAVVAGVVAIFALYLRVSQVAVGFVLALQVADGFYFAAVGGELPGRAALGADDQVSVSATVICTWSMVRLFHRGSNRVLAKRSAIRFCSVSLPR